MATGSPNFGQNIRLRISAENLWVCNFDATRCAVCNVGKFTYSFNQTAFGNAHRDYPVVLVIFEKALGIHLLGDPAARCAPAQFNE